MSDVQEPDLVSQASLAMEAIESELRGEGHRIRRHLEVMNDLVELLAGAEFFEAGAASMRGYQAGDGVICTLCHSVIITPHKGQRAPNLLDLLVSLKGHSCRPKEEEDLTEVQKARKDMEARMDDLRTEGADPQWVSDLVSATLKLVHEVVREERARVSATYENSGLDRMDDLDALDHVVELTDPEVVLRG